MVVMPVENELDKPEDSWLVSRLLNSLGRRWHSVKSHHWFKRRQQRFLRDSRSVQSAGGSN
jgi:hypothetical protein